MDGRKPRCFILHQTGHFHRMKEKKVDERVKKLARDAEKIKSIQVDAG